MRIRLLGTAAGGGVPQWNCNCAGCREARSSTGRVKPRLQSGVAVSADEKHWFLLNASPDLRAQIESFPPLQPQPGNSRNSPIQGVLLTNADLDHALGLFLLREGETIPVLASDAIRSSLTSGLALGSVLDAFCGVEWLRPSSTLSPLLLRNGQPSGLLCQAIEAGGKAPRYLPGSLKAVSGNALGYRISDERTGGRLLFFPELAALTPVLVEEFRQCDALLLDGTFWSETEMLEQGVGTATAATMGHLTISSQNGTLKVLAGLKTRHKIYVHINNTNPILFEDSPERAEVNAAGVIVGMDGMDLTL
jgi:pyrroloquinoline quinone biosynthesis protein B